MCPDCNKDHSSQEKDYPTGTKEAIKPNYAAGMVDDPLAYAIDTLDYVESLIGQDKRVTLARMALQELARKEAAGKETAKVDD